MIKVVITEEAITGETLRFLLGQMDISARNFAHKIPMHESNFSRMLSSGEAWRKYESTVFSTLGVSKVYFTAVRAKVKKALTSVGVVIQPTIGDLDVRLNYKDVQKILKVTM